MKNKILAALAGVALVVGSGLATAEPADAAYGNKIQNSSNRCTTFIWEPGTSGRVSICGLNNYAFNVRYVVVHRGTCLDIGYWAFTRYCASAYYDRHVYIGPGTHFIR